MLFFPALGTRDLWAPVEPRYAEIVRVMYAHGEWIVPTVNGALYTDKPILYFWVALFAAHLWGGVNEWVVRLPAALGGTGFVLATYFIGREFFSARIGALAALVLATSFRVIWEARWAHVDTLFGFFFALTIFFGARCLFRRNARHETALVYVCMALATLTKGLIGVVLPALLLLAFVSARRDWSLLRSLKLPLGIPIFVLVAAPWFYLVSRASGGTWLADFLYVHHFQRYTAGAGHRQPFFYYLTTLPADFLPWTAFLIPAALQPRCRQQWREPGTQFFLLWFAVVFLFFSLSETKRDLYLLPLFPPLALMVACYLNDLAIPEATDRGVHFWFAVLFFVLVALAGLVLPILASVRRPDALRPLLPGACVLGLGGAATAALILRRQTISAALSVAAMMLGLTANAAFGMFPYLEQFKSHRDFSAEIRRLVPREAPLYVFEDSMDDFNYYTGREEIPVLASPGEIASLRSSKEKSYVLIKHRDLRKLPEIGRETVIAHNTLGNTTWYLVGLGQ